MSKPIDYSELVRMYESVTEISKYGHPNGKVNKTEDSGYRMYCPDCQFCGFASYSAAVALGWLPDGQSNEARKD